jgi:hypothetical protein
MRLVNLDGSVRLLTDLLSGRAVKVWSWVRRNFGICLPILDMVNCLGRPRGKTIALGIMGMCLIESSSANPCKTSLLSALRGIVRLSRAFLWLFREAITVFSRNRWASSNSSFRSTWAPFSRVKLTVGQKSCLEKIFVDAMSDETPIRASKLILEASRFIDTGDNFLY